MMQLRDRELDRRIAAARPVVPPGFSNGVIAHINRPRTYSRGGVVAALAVLAAIVALIVGGTFERELVTSRVRVTVPVPTKVPSRDASAGAATVSPLEARLLELDAEIERMLADPAADLTALRAAYDESWALLDQRPPLPEFELAGTTVDEKRREIDRLDGEIKRFERLQNALMRLP